MRARLPTRCRDPTMDSSHGRQPWAEAPRLLHDLGDYISDLHKLLQTCGGAVRLICMRVTRHRHFYWRAMRSFAVPPAPSGLSSGWSPSPPLPLLTGPRELARRDQVSGSRPLQQHQPLGCKRATHEPARCWPWTPLQWRAWKTWHPRPSSACPRPVSTADWTRSMQASSSTT